MPGQGRLGDKASVSLDTHGCPACPHPAIGPAIQGSPDVNVNRRPALRVDDPGVHAACCGTNTWTATKGSATVFINGKAAHRMGDQNRHCGGMGELVEGSPNVIVGDSGGGSGGSASRGGGGAGAGTAAAAVAAAASVRGGAGPSARPGDQSAPGRAYAPAATSSAPAVNPRLTFIELSLVDSDGQPVEGVKYRVTGSDGTVFTGRLDARGGARVDGIAEGRCEVTFPELHAEDWDPV